MDRRFLGAELRGSSMAGKEDGWKTPWYDPVGKRILEIRGNKISGGTFVIDMSSITNLDLKDEDTNKKLAGHLKADDFFGVEKYPTATFVLSESSDFVNGKATVSGEITIKANTEKISFDVMKEGEAFTAKVEIDRSKYDVCYGSKSFFNNLGDRAINDIFTLDFPDQAFYSPGMGEFLTSTYAVAANTGNWDREKEEG